MEQVTAQSLVMEAGKSAELRALFLALADMRTVKGDPWHLPKARRWVEQLIACRAYAPALHQLCHLLPVAEALGGRDGYLGFFWRESTARSAGCRALLADLPRAAGRLTEGTLTIALADRSYDLSVGTLPRLVCLMHFLQSLLGYATLRDVLTPLRSSGLRSAEVSRVANDMAKRTYDALAAHLPTVQAQRRTQAVLVFMTERAGPGFGRDAVDDAAILDLWDGLIDLDGDLGRSFEAAYHAALDLRRLLAQGHDLRVFEHQASIGGDREAGEVEPDNAALLAACETLQERTSPLDQLAEPPADTVKALNKRETARLADLVEAGEEAGALALSLLRLAVFRPAQLRISQGLRRKLTAAQMKELIETAAETDYPAETDEFTALASHLLTVRLASAAVLAQAGHEATFTLASHLLTHDERQDMQQIISQQPDLMRALEDCGFLKRAAAGLKKINRQGFRPTDLEDAATIEGHGQAIAPLQTVTEQLTAFEAALARLDAEHPWATRFAEDLPRFTDRFHRLYGEAS
ncbi:hypothetical protein JCM17960_00260 [Magnetospira thiophila]